ncbi:MAG: linear amide C-N hydrolase, partial [Bacteroidota bacterium]
CTFIKIDTLDEGVIVGRSLETGGSDQISDLTFIPQGLKYTDVLPKHLNPLSWKGKYAYCGIDFGGYPGYANTLVNEKDFTVDALYNPDYTQYEDAPSTDKNVHRLAALDLAPWIASNYESCQDFLTKGLPLLQNKEIVVKDMKVPAFPYTPYHIAMSDPSGTCIVMEFSPPDSSISKVANYPQIYDNTDIGVLTNAPSFHWHRNNLKNYVNLSPINAKPISLSNTQISQFGQGSGMLGLPGDYTPPSRFIRIALLKHASNPVNSGHQGVNLALHLLNNVDIPKGTIRATATYQGLGDHTHHIGIRDLKNGMYYWRTYDDLSLAGVNYRAIFEEMSKSNDGKVRSVYMGKTKEKPAYIDLTKDVVDYAYQISDMGTLVKFETLYPQLLADKRQHKTPGKGTKYVKAIPVEGFPAIQKKLLGYLDNQKSAIDAESQNE